MHISGMQLVVATKSMLSSTTFLKALLNTTINTLPLYFTLAYFTEF